MSSSPPEEAIHYRGKTLTPESPRPLHIPEPSNIPLLQKQIDPLFNPMSTHIEPLHIASNLATMDHFMGESNRAAADPSHPGFTGNGDSGLDERKENGQAATTSLKEKSENAEQAQSDSSIDENNVSTITDQHSASMASFDIPPNSSLSMNISNLPPNPSILSFSANNSQHATLGDPSQATPAIAEGAEGAAPNSGQSNEPTAPGGDDGVANGGVNYQALLDNIVPLNAAAPSTTTSQSGALASDANSADIPAPSTANLPSATFPIAGLPPRPPPQEKPAIHPNYVPGEDIRSYHYPHIHHANTQATQASRPAQTYATPGMPLTGSNGIPPPPLASFQQPSGNQEQQDHPDSQPARPRENAGRSGPAVQGDEALMQQKYEAFLDDENVFTSEGTWDKFPQGSRLFVGNLPTELVTKRDIFDIFHRYGRLAQISIKQAYGFVQFMDAEACMTALQKEQGGRLKDRNMHLEVSKPPKNTRNAASSAAGNNLRASHYRRSRSPDQGRRPGSRAQRNARNVPFSDFRDEPRRRDDYRPGRSPSPRGGRGRDEYRGGRDRSPDRYYDGRRRSRSPYGRGQARRSPSPRRRSVDDDDALPLPRRSPGEVPDVQLILIDELNRDFVTYVQRAFNDRGLRCDFLLLPRVSLAAVIKRQILEGVQAVVKLHRSSQNTGKIPLQLFDRSGGADNVRFEEYDDLDAHIAAELVNRAKQTQTAARTAQSSFPPITHSYGTGHYIQQLPPQQQQQPAPTAGQPNLANLITSLDGPALQKLLGAMQQSASTPTQQQFPQQSPTHNPNLSALLSGVNPQVQPQPQQQTFPQNYQYQPPQQQQQQQPPPQQQYPFGMPYQQPAAPQYAQAQQAQPQSHVQNIMEQLARYKQ